MKRLITAALAVLLLLSGVSCGSRENPVPPGAPARSGLVQTAVVSGESKRCDALSTALFVMGLDGAVRYWREHRDFEMVLLAEDRTVYVTEGLSDLFSLGAGQEGRELQIIRSAEATLRRS